MKLKPALGLLFVLVLIANITLFVLGKINALIFWIVILIVALFAFYVLPRMKNERTRGRKKVTKRS